MTERKQPGRFTVQFNLEDPGQRKAAEVLDRQGRRKAQFLAGAILSYVQTPASGNGVIFPGIDEKTLEQMVLAILEKHPQFAVTGQKNADEETGVPEETSSAWNASGQALTAISNTLAAFQNK